MTIEYANYHIKSPEPTAVGAVSSAVAVPAASRRWFSFLPRQQTSMALPIEILEDFFEVRFHFKDQPLGQLTHFDGYVHWHVLYDRERQFLKIVAGRDPVLSAYPTAEIEGIYSDDCSVSPLTGGGMALVLRPKGVDNTSNCVAITKTKNGSLSLSTTVGAAEAVA